MKCIRPMATLFALLLIGGACGSDGDGSTAGDGTWPDKITFGFVPSQEQDQLQDDIQPFIDVLEAALGIDVEGFVTTDYTGLVTAMGNYEPSQLSRQIVFNNDGTAHTVGKFRRLI